MSQAKETDAPGLPASLDAAAAAAGYVDHSDPSFAAGSAVPAADDGGFGNRPGGERDAMRDAIDYLWLSDDTHLAEEERRLARDGNPHTFGESVDYYGEEWAARYWNSADIHRAEESRGGPLQIRANDAVLIHMPSSRLSSRSIVMIILCMCTIARRFLIPTFQRAAECHHLLLMLRLEPSSQNLKRLQPE